MTRHRIAREPIEIETGYTGLDAPSLEIVLELLAFPSGFSSPFLDESFAVGFDEGEGFVVLWFEEEGDAQDGEFEGVGGRGGGGGEDGVDGAVEVLLPDVPVGSQCI